MAVDADRDLFADTYRATAHPDLRTDDIGGLPAVRQKGLDEQHLHGHRRSGPTQALEAEWTGPHGPRAGPCSQAEEAISLVIRKLPPQK